MYSLSIQQFSEGKSLWIVKIVEKVVPVFTKKNTFHNR